MALTWQVNLLDPSLTRANLSALEMQRKKEDTLSNLTNIQS